ncbi:MAG: dienelactone hydrolase family protein [Halieaceae bacterium]|jgi:dienelactone hydrolase|nr:dienelactone hydrolase family protein [Halieaceae bacterium]
MALKERTLVYDIDGAPHEGLLVWDDANMGPRPGVLVAHAWAGRTEFEDDKARWLAAQGYVGFALDVYGQGVRGSSTEENAALMTPFMEDRARLQKHLLAALTAMREQSEVDAARCAGIGFCFGGLCMLDLARIGTEVAGVVSVHGLLTPPGNTEGRAIGTSVLCLHGYDDPMAPPESVLELAKEMSAAGADWQLHAYGGTVHAFTNPQAQDPDFGTVYSERASRRAHAAMIDFLAELFPA